MSRDPLGYADGVNIYAYVGNNPTTYVDPWGTEKVLLASTSVDFVLQNTHRLDLNDPASWNRVNAHIDVICMMPGNYNHYHCVDAVRGSVQLVGMTDEQVLRLANVVENVGIVLLLRKGVKYAVKEVAGDESCAAFARMFSSPESMMVGGSLCMIGVGSMSQKEFDNIMRMAGKADDVANISISNLKDILKRQLSHIDDNYRFTKLGLSNDEIIDGISNIISKKSGKLKNGDNTIVSKINGETVTIRVNVANGALRNVNAFPGESPRVLGNLIE